MDGLILREITKKINDNIAGSLVRDIYFINKELIFKLNTGVLFIDLEANMPKIQYYNQNKKFKNINFKSNNPFFRYLRKNVKRSKIKKIETVDNDRVIDLTVSKLTPLGVKEFNLYFEFIGKLINAYFVEEGKIKHLLKPKKGRRALEIDDEYKFPKNKRLDFLNYNIDEAADKLKNGKKIHQVFKNVSPFLNSELKYLLSKDNTVKNILKKFNKRFKKNNYYIYKKNKKYFLSSIKMDSFTEIDKDTNIINLVNKYYDKILKEKKLREKIKELRKIIISRIKKDKRTIKKIKSDREKHLKYKKYKIYGDLLLAYKHKVKEGMDEIELKNYESGENEKINLDPNLNANENAEKYYSKFKKGKRALRKIQLRIKELKNEIEYLKQVKYFSSNISDKSGYLDIKQELEEMGLIKIKKNKKQRRNNRKSKYKYITYKDYKIYYGRSAKENEKVSLKLGNQDDWWFHVRNGVGSHVVIKYKGEEIPDEIFEAASQLAVYFSDSSGGSKVSVDYTKCKNVKKPKGTPPGFVIYDNFKTIIVDQDEIYLKKIFKSEER